MLYLSVRSISDFLVTSIRSKYSSVSRLKRHIDISPLISFPLIYLTLLNFLLMRKMILSVKIVLYEGFLLYLTISLITILYLVLGIITIEKTQLIYKRVRMAFIVIFEDSTLWQIISCWKIPLFVWLPLQALQTTSMAKKGLTVWANLTWNVIFAFLCACLCCSEENKDFIFFFL